MPAYEEAWALNHEGIVGYGCFEVDTTMLVAEVCLLKMGLMRLLMAAWGQLGQNIPLLVDN